MTREELIDLIMDHSAGATDNVADGVCYKTLADAILKRISLPPAEGAEQVRGQCQNPITNEDNCNVLAKKKTCVGCKYFSPEPYPTAEGAEEILDKHSRYHPVTNLVYREDVLSAMNEFATLHAQRLAEKMVEERLREELIKFFEYLDEYIPMVIHGGTAEIIINEYLKSRDSHEQHR